VILDPKNYDAWLGPQIQDTTILKALLKSFPAEKMQSWPVDRIINKVGEDETN
jgi:putative SOS response-associated peptidase YedK